MRLFEAHQSPQKTVADLLMPVPCAEPLVEVKPAPVALPLPLKANNLLKTRKTCERKQINISEVASVDQKIISFGQFISG
jgi:hypothetical protein